MHSASLQQQLQHMEWADSSLWHSVLSCEAARSDSRLHELLHHVHLVQQLYLQIWREERLTLSKPEQFPDLEALCDWGKGFYGPASQFLSSLTSEDLQVIVSFPWAAQLVQRFGSVHPATLEESILQIVLHTTHHRAQVCTRLRELECEPPLVDFIAWIWQGKPAADWESATRF